MELLRKGKFGPLFFLFEIFDHVSKGKFGPDSEKNLDQTCLLKTSPSRDSNYSKKERKKVDQTCLFEATPTVILDSFKHFSGPKYKTTRMLNTSFAERYINIIPILQVIMAQQKGIISVS